VKSSSVLRVERDCTIIVVLTYERIIIHLFLFFRFEASKIVIFKFINHQNTYVRMYNKCFTFRHVKQIVYNKAINLCCIRLKLNKYEL